MKKTIALLVCVMLTMSVAVGCGKKIGRVDPNTTLIVFCYDGGFGTAWLDKVAKEFEKTPEADGYKVHIVPVKDEYGSIRTSLLADSTTTDVFFAEASKVQELIALELILELTDIYDDVVDTVDGHAMTLEDSIKTEFLPFMGTGYGTDKAKYYALPYFDTITGFVYDHGMFEDKGWLMTDNSTNNGLDVGADGVEGTRDDGLPVTLSDFSDMIISIKQSSGIPFHWSSTYNFYTSFVLNGIMAQYEGIDNFDLQYSFSGTHSDPRIGAITPETGNKLYDVDGRLKALEFMKTYLLGSQNYHSSVTGSSNSHFAAQGDFVYSKESNSPVAMLIEGNWWENEAKTKFSLTTDGYGKRDYRMMPYPKIEGQKGADGDGNGNVFYSFSANSSVYIRKTTNKPEVAKAFLKFTSTQKALKTFNLTSGGFRPFNYTLSETEQLELTKFQRNTYSIYNDPLVKIARPLSTNPLINFSSEVDMWKANSYALPVTAMMHNSVTPKQYFDNAKALYTQSKWTSIYNSVAKYF